MIDYLNEFEDKGFFIVPIFSMNLKEKNYYQILIKSKGMFLVIQKTKKKWTPTFPYSVYLR